MAGMSLDQVSVSISTMESELPGGPSPERKKVRNHNSEAQRLSHLPRRSPVDLEFIDLTYTVPDGPWWQKRGTADLIHFFPFPGETTLSPAH